MKIKENLWLAAYLNLLATLPLALCLVLMLMMCHSPEVCGLPFRLVFLHSPCRIKQSARQPRPPAHQTSEHISRQQKTDCKQPDSYVYDFCSVKDVSRRITQWRHKGILCHRCGFQSLNPGTVLDPVQLNRTSLLWGIPVFPWLHVQTFKPQSVIVRARSYLLPIHWLCFTLFPLEGVIRELL